MRKTARMIGAYALLLCLGCGAEPDTPAQSTNTFPTGAEWRLQNKGITPRTVRSDLRQGKVLGTTRQLTLIAPVTGRVRLSGELGMRWGTDPNNLQAVSGANYATLGVLRCELNTEEAQARDFTETCEERRAGVEMRGCNWSIPVHAGENELRMVCAIRSNGEATAFTMGVLTLMVCAESGMPCMPVAISPAVLYQAGAEVARPTGLVVHTINLGR